VCDSFLLNWFAASNFHDQDSLIYMELCNVWFAIRNTRDDEALLNFANFSHMRIKVGLQYQSLFVFFMHPYINLC
jgi:hypothetical protein